MGAPVIEQALAAAVGFRMDQYNEHMHKCIEERGRRHQTKKYTPNPDVAKDEVTHSMFWRSKRWQDPVPSHRKVRGEFDMCPFSMFFVEYVLGVRHDQVPLS